MTFEEFYITWYSRLKNFAREYLLSEEDAEDVVQGVFTDLYEKFDLLTGQINPVAYVFTSVKNRCIDQIRRRLLEQDSASKMQEEFGLTLQMKRDSLEAFDPDLFHESDVAQLIEKALAILPERCRLIFIRHKIEGKKHTEIASELNISVKTIETQITIAYKKLRVELKPYFPLLILLFG